jgi:hypothetical protein
VIGADVRRRKLLVALAGLAVVVAAVVVVLWPRPDRITQENYDRIRVGGLWGEDWATHDNRAPVKKGMTRTEVEAILGPPGDYRTGLGEQNWGESRETGYPIRIPILRRRTGIGDSS